ncbi:hypothetical protein HY750_00680 [Candidatus Kuenenbacteria bacterium]|nr:hypothetical protein [Candidatus Kuenenbacteria bacterium]
MNDQANEIFYYLADLKYDNFSLQKNDVIYLIKDKKETVDILDDFDIISAIEFNDNFQNNSNPTNSKNEKGPTYLNGELEADTILSAENNPYIVEENFTIPENKILTINSGVVIWPKNKDLFGDVNLTAKGTLIINGTKENPVKFTSLNKNPKLLRTSVIN